MIDFALFVFQLLTFKISGIIGISIAFSVFPVLKGLRRVLFHQIFYDVFIHRLTHSVAMSSFFQCFPVLFLAFAAEYQKSLQYLGKLVWSRLARVKSLHVQKKFSIKVLYSKCDQIRSFQQIWSHILKKFTEEFCAVIIVYDYKSYPSLILQLFYQKLVIFKCES